MPCIEKKHPSVCPSSPCWILEAAVNCYVSLVDECFKVLQGRDTLIPEHKARIRNLTENMQYSVSIEGPVSGFDLLTKVLDGSVTGQIDCARKTFLVRKESVTNFLEDASKTTVNDLEELTLDERNTIEL